MITKFDEYFINENAENVDIDSIIAEFQKIAQKTIPKFNVTIKKYKSFDGSFDIAIHFRTSDFIIDRHNDNPEFASYILLMDSMELQEQGFGGLGGGRVTRKPNPNNPDEKYLAMKGEKIPFRKPQPNIKAIYKAFEKLCIAYKDTVKKIYDMGLLRYPDSTDYSKLF